MWELSHTEGWTLKNQCFRTVVLEKTLRVPWTAGKSYQSILKEINPEYSFKRLMLKLKLQIWPPDTKSQLIGKDLDAGKDWRQKEKGMTEEEMVKWHHQLNGHEFEQAPGNGEGEGNLACCSPWSRKELDTTEWLNWICVTQRKPRLKGKQGPVSS